MEKYFESGCEILQGGETMTPLDNILARLDQVRQRQAGQYSARCPAHADTGPSLSVRESTDGSVLVHCFAGCTAYEILASIGLELHDLYPPRERPPGAPKRQARLLTAGQALELLADESMLVAVAAANVGHGFLLTEIDLARVLAAAGRINLLHEYTGAQHA